MLINFSYVCLVIHIPVRVKVNKKENQITFGDRCHVLWVFAGQCVFLLCADVLIEGNIP